MRVINLDEAAKLSAKLKSAGRKISATNGCFDVLHLGHLKYLEKSKELADVLIVGVNADQSVKQLKGNSRPIHSEQDRAELLAGLKPVDYVVIFPELDACNFLEAVKPDFYTKGGDYTPEALEKWPEYSTASKLGCKIVLVDFIEGKSSTKILEKLDQ